MLIILAIIFSLRDSNKDNNYSEIISPNFDVKTFKDDKLWQVKSQYVLISFEKAFINWRDILNVVSFNRAILIKDSTLTEKDRELITSKLIPKNFRITLGNVNDLVTQYGDLIKELCNNYKLDWRLILAMIRQESYFNPEAISKAGAYGLMQIMPGTGSGLQNELNLPDTKTPQNNLTAGIYYYATLVGAFEFTKEEKYKFALASYNAGLSRVIDIMTIANYFKKDYTKWDIAKEYFPYLASGNDSLHKLIFASGRPSGGILNNWQEPYKYVEYIMFYYDYFKNVYKNNLPEETKKTSKKKKK